MSARTPEVLPYPNKLEPCECFFVRPVLRSLWPLIIATAAAAALIVSVHFLVPPLAALHFGYLAVVPVILLGELIRRYYNNVYTFSSNAIIQISGRISFSKHDQRILYRDIRSISVEQSLIGRLLGYGSVRIYSSSPELSGLCLCGLARPHDLARALEGLRERSESLLRDRRLLSSHLEALAA